MVAPSPLWPGTTRRSQSKHRGVPVGISSPQLGQVFIGKCGRSGQVSHRERDAFDDRYQFALCWAATLPRGTTGEAPFTF